MAVTASAIAACHTLRSVFKFPTAPLELTVLEALAAAAAGVPTGMLDVVKEGDAEDDKTEEAEEAATETEVASGAVPMGDSATAEEGFTRVPSPQGISAPSGWVELGGGVVFPLASAIAKRVVQ